MQRAQRPSTKSMIRTRRQDRCRSNVTPSYLSTAGGFPIPLCRSLPPNGIASVTRLTAERVLVDLAHTGARDLGGKSPLFRDPPLRYLACKKGFEVTFLECAAGRDDECVGSFLPFWVRYSHDSHLEDVGV